MGLRLSVEVSLKDNRLRGQSAELLKRDLSGVAQIRQFNQDFVDGHIAIAKEVLKEEQQRGFPKKPIQRVDGSIKKPLELLKPFGRIDFFAQITPAKALLDIYLNIQKRTIVGQTGYLKASNKVIVDGRVVASNVVQLENWLRSSDANITSGSSVIFVNTAPYARKLERFGYRRGKRGYSDRRDRKVKSRQTGSLIQAPNGAYWLAYRASKRKLPPPLSNFFKFKFIPGSLLGDAIPNDRFRRTFAKARRVGGVGRPYLYPTLVLQLDQRGLALGDSGQTFSSTGI